MCGCAADAHDSMDAAVQIFQFMEAMATAGHVSRQCNMNVDGGQVAVQAAAAWYVLWQLPVRSSACAPEQAGFLQQPWLINSVVAVIDKV